MAMVLDTIEENLRHRFSDPDLLLEALTHPSWSAEHDPPEPDNQRLEFLGDSVLQLITTAMLFRRLPDEPEGVLTKVRSALTKESMLVHHATVLGLGDALRLGRGELQNGGRDRASNLGDAFEAVLGALYLDAGLPAASNLVHHLSEGFLDDIQSLLSEENPKGALQELTQEHFRCIPRYRTLGVTGPEHEPEFEVAVIFRGKQIGCATAGSRRDAERQAAEEALRYMKEICDVD